MSIRRPIIVMLLFLTTLFKIRETFKSAATYLAVCVKNIMYSKVVYNSEVPITLGAVISIHTRSELIIIIDEENENQRLQG